LISPSARYWTDSRNLNATKETTMPKLDPDTGQPVSDDPDQAEDDLAGGDGGMQDPDREKGEKGPDEQQVTGH